MKKVVVVIGILASAALLWLIGGYVWEYYQPYRKIVIRCDAGRNG